MGSTWILAPSGRVTPPKRFWDSSRQGDLEFAEYEILLGDDAALLSWLAHLRDYGYALLRNAPIGDGTVLRIAELFGFVRETNYGRLFDVTVTPDPANLANTSVRIGMHTDNPYRDPVPGLQLLNCLVNEASGGESQLCDGFRVADSIRREAPEAFQLLTEYPVGFRYFETGQTDLQSYQPLIEVDALGEIRRIRYNSRSAAAIRVPAETVDDFYAAYRLLSERLNAPESLIEFRLEPGDCMIFDNERVLHGRASFELGHRHLQGCYADKDALHSKIRVLEAG